MAVESRAASGVTTSADALPARTLYGAPALLVLLAVLTLLRVAFVALGPYPLDPEEAQYWSYGEAPAFGYYSKPPLLPWLIAATTSLAGDTAFGVRLAAPFLHALGAWFVFLTGRRLFGAGPGFWAGALYATLPGVSLSAGLMTTDVPLLLCWSIGLYTLLRALDGDGLAWWAATGAAIGLGLLGKYTMIAFVASALLFVLASPQDRPALRGLGPPVALLAALMVVAPNLVWNARHDFATIAHVGDNASLGGDLFHLDRLLEFLAAQLGIANPIAFAVLVLLIAGAGGAWGDRRLRYLLCFAAPILLVISLESFLTRAHGNWAAAAYVSGTAAVAAWLWRAGRARWLGAALALNLAAAALWLVYGTALGVAAERFPGYLDPLAKLRGSPGMGRELEAAMARYPDSRLLVADRRLMALCLFYGGVPLERAAKWNPDRGVDDHYDLVAGLAPDATGSYVFVTRADPGDVLARFAEVERLASIAVPTHADRDVRFELLHLAGFEGYADGEER